MEKKIKSVKNGLDEQIERTCQKNFKDFRIKMGIKIPNQDVLLNEPNKDFKREMIMKADKVDIEKLYEIKSNKQSTDNMLDV